MNFALPTQPCFIAGLTRHLLHLSQECPHVHMLPQRPGEQMIQERLCFLHEQLGVARLDQWAMGRRISAQQQVEPGAYTNRLFQQMLLLKRKKWKRHLSFDCIEHLPLLGLSPREPHEKRRKHQNERECRQLPSHFRMKKLLLHSKNKRSLHLWSKNHCPSPLVVAPVLQDLALPLVWSLLLERLPIRGQPQGPRSQRIFLSSIRALFTYCLAGVSCCSRFSGFCTLFHLTWRCRVRFSCSLLGSWPICLGIGSVVSFIRCSI